jgi:hypothetical protein
MVLGLRFREILAGPRVKLQGEIFVTRLQERPVEMVAVKDS